MLASTTPISPTFSHYLNLLCLSLPKSPCAAPITSEKEETRVDVAIFMNREETRESRRLL
jgi:hypothetical protein